MKKLLDYAIAAILGVVIIIISYLLSLKVAFPLLDLLSVRLSVGNMFLLDFFTIILLTCLFAFLIAMIGFRIFKHVTKGK